MKTRSPRTRSSSVKKFQTRLSDRASGEPALFGRVVVVLARGDGGARYMSQFSRGILTAVAVMLTLGAVPLALGRDLTSASDHQWATAPAGIISTGVNRTAKTDRVGAAARSAAVTRTISLQVNGLSETSVLLRIPVADAAGRRAPGPLLIKSGERKSATVACEPMVSVLTEVAKQLQPGRCVT